ncbi:MAG TPA: hypothetical protein VK020_00135 [Microlunatus sp.]|nr:hypothetical protein [Microlunatus sp.]
MPWHWTYTPAAEDGKDRSPDFPRQGDAESWLGELYPDLYDLGVRSVTLYEDGRRVYGPMSLEAEG